jgi:arylsulfatase A-like enzyme
MMNRRGFLQRSLAATGTISGSVRTSISGTEGHHLPDTEYPHPNSAGRELPDPEYPAHPNVIWVFGDQHRAQALTFNGDPNVRTPCLERAEINGINFSRNVSGYPLCAPFRGSLLTGLYPHKCVPRNGYPLPAGQKTIADVFNSHGYDTAYFGKWHLGAWDERNGRAAFYITDPSRRGNFHTWVGYQDNDSPWDCWVHGGCGKDAFHYRLPGYETDELTNLLIKYLKKKGEEQRTGRGKPFFAVLSVEPPHDPYGAPQRFMGRFNPQHIELRENVERSSKFRENVPRDLTAYYAAIEALDWNYGRVIQTLEETGLYFSTHILFFSDHGDMLGSHGLYGKAVPYEEAIRTPMIISGGQPRYDGWLNGRVPVLTSQVDIAPTTLGLCGIPKADWMVGTDYSHYRYNKTADLYTYEYDWIAHSTRAVFPEPDSVYLQNIVPDGKRGIVTNPLLGNPGATSWRGLVTKEGWKYVCFNDFSWLMFNLNEDPYEESNLVYNNKYRNERKKLIERLKQWVADTGDEFTVPKD